MFNSFHYQQGFVWWKKKTTNKHVKLVKKNHKVAKLPFFRQASSVFLSLSCLVHSITSLIFFITSKSYKALLCMHSKSCSLICMHTKWPI